MERIWSEGIQTKKVQEGFQIILCKGYRWQVTGVVQVGRWLFQE
jgi:hypothetical protein